MVSPAVFSAERAYAQMKLIVQKFLKEHPELHHWSPIILVERNLRLWAELKEPILLVRNRCRP